MKLPDFKLFSDKSARIVFIFPSNCQNFHGFLKLEVGGGGGCLGGGGGYLVHL